MGQRRRVISGLIALAALAALAGLQFSKGPDSGPFSAFASSAGPHLCAPHVVPKPLYPFDGANYYSYPLPNGSTAHVVIVNMRNGLWRFRPALAEPTTAATSRNAVRYGATAATNAGYFNLKEGGQSTSYIVIDGKVVADPHDNSLLTGNPKLIPHLPKIFNRTEVRFFSDNSIQFAKHQDSLPKGKTLLHSIQAGPRLLPAIDAEEEAFSRVDPDGTKVDAINLKKPAARTAFGTTPDGYAVMMTIAGKGQDPESSGATLAALASALKALGCSDAINFDGGASTTMFIRPRRLESIAKEDPPAGEVVCAKHPETLVKSILMLCPAVR